jgi:CheY-like chemotaxis protein
MYARNVSLCLKPSSVVLFTLILETEVLPLLRNQQGFWGLIVFVTQDGSRALGTSLWHHGDGANAYSRRTYPEVLKALANVIEGPLQVQAYEVSGSIIRRMIGSKALMKEIPQLEIYEVDSRTFHQLAGTVISALLLHELSDSLDPLKVALESQSVKTCWLRTCAEALPLLEEADPPHLVFTPLALPDGTWTDVVNLAVKAPRPVNVIVVARSADIGLYLDTISGGAFDFIVPPLTDDELGHVVRCALANVLGRREAQASVSKMEPSAPGLPSRGLKLI